MRLLAWGALFLPHTCFVEWYGIPAAFGTSLRVFCESWWQAWPVFATLGAAFVLGAAVGVAVRR